MRNQIIFIGDEVLRKINTADIVYIESDRHKTNIHFIDKIIVSNRPLKEWLDLLDKDFIHVHRGIIVNVYHVSQMYDNQILLDNAKIVPVSRRRIIHVREVLKHFIGDSL